MAFNNKLFYHPDTGLVLWRKDNKNVKYGDIAGTLTSDGYIQVVVNGRCYRMHNVIYELIHGEEVPKGHEVDHINGIGTDNRACNLRLLPSKLNRVHKPTTKGCHQIHNGKWIAQKKIDGKSTHIGTYSNQEEARTATLRFVEEHYNLSKYRTFADVLGG